MVTVSAADVFHKVAVYTAVEHMQVTGHQRPRHSSPDRQGIRQVSGHPDPLFRRQERQQGFDAHIFRMYRKIGHRLFAPQVNGPIRHMPALIQGQHIFANLRDAVMDFQAAMPFFDNKIPVHRLAQTGLPRKIEPVSLPINMKIRRKKAAARFTKGCQNRSQRHIAHPSPKIIGPVVAYFTGGLQRAAATESGKVTNFRAFFRYVSIKIQYVQHQIPPPQIHDIRCDIHFQGSLFPVIGAVAGQRRIHQYRFLRRFFTGKGHITQIPLTGDLSFL